ALAVTALEHLSDSWTEFQNKVRSATSSSEQFAYASQGLAQIADDTRRGLDTVAQTILRVREATENLGLSADQSMAFVKELNETVIIQGASTSEANHA